VTPCWDEPYGLVVAESLAVGTPVAAFARGAVPDVISPASGRLAEPGNVGALANAIRAAMPLQRSAVRARAEQSCDVHRMVDAYVELYRDITGPPAIKLPVPFRPARPPARTATAGFGVPS